MLLRSKENGGERYEEDWKSFSGITPWIFGVLARHQFLLLSNVERVMPFFEEIDRVYYIAILWVAFLPWNNVRSMMRCLFLDHGVEFEELSDTSKTNTNFSFQSFFQLSLLLM